MQFAEERILVAGAWLQLYRDDFYSLRFAALSGSSEFRVFDIRSNKRGLTGNEQEYVHVLKPLTNLLVPLFASDKPLVTPRSQSILLFKHVKNRIQALELPLIFVSIAHKQPDRGGRSGRVAINRAGSGFFLGKIDSLISLGIST